MFEKTYLKLAGLYLAVLMLLCIFFSLNIYQLSLTEFERGLKRPVSVVEGRSGEVVLSVPAQRPRDEREVIIREVKGRIIMRLLMINLGVLLGGGLLSYYLARWTFRPIEDAHEAQNRFTADASHELRTPLAAMRSEIEVALLAKKLSIKDARALLESNLEEVTKLTQLSEGLLKLASIDGRELQLEEQSISSLISSAATRVSSSAKLKNIDVAIESKDSVTVLVEPISLAEALVILLDNAIKYSPEKSKVTVRVKRLAHEVQIQVIDTGVGVKAGELPHIFDRFYRVDTARTKQNVSGYGLGLSIAQRIVEMHGGHINVKSQHAKGSTFTVTLPT